MLEAERRDKFGGGKKAEEEKKKAEEKAAKEKHDAQVQAAMQAAADASSGLNEQESKFRCMKRPRK